jgi:hypothetical protein
MSEEIIREVDFYVKTIGKYRLIGCYECNSLFLTLKDFYSHLATHKKKFKTNYY